MLASLTENPRAPVHTDRVPFCALLSWEASVCGSAIAPEPKARRILDPSTVMSADSWPAARSEVQEEPGPDVEAGVSSRNSCQRRPLTGSAWISVVLREEVTAGAAGSGAAAMRIGRFSP